MTNVNKTLISVAIVFKILISVAIVLLVFLGICVKNSGLPMFGHGSDSSLISKLDEWKVVVEGDDRDLATFCFDGYRFLAVVPNSYNDRYGSFSFIQFHNVDGPDLCFNPFEDADTDGYYDLEKEFSD